MRHVKPYLCGMSRKITAATVARMIRANVEAYHARTIDHEAFSAEQDRLWRYAETRSERFIALVSRGIMA